MSEIQQTFRVYIVGSQTPGEAVEVQSADPFSAAQAFLSRAANTATDIEIAVISTNGFEDVYGYRNIVPQAHLDD